MDRSGILWVSTNEGVDKLDTDQKPFFHYQHHASDPYSLSDNTVSALVEDGEGTLWIGTFGGGVNAWDKKTKRFTHYRHDARNPYSLATDRVSALLVDREQNLWVANGQMLSRLDKQTGQFTHTQLEHPFMLPGDFADPVFAMCQDKAGQLWLATTNGILAFNPTTGATRSYTHTPYSSEGISDYWSLSVMEDKSGNLWIGNSSIALDKLDPKTGKFTHYRHDHGNPNSISSNGVKSLFEDSKGNLWLGTRQGGLCRFDSTTDTFTAYTEKQGLAGTNVYSVLEDDAGNLWEGTFSILPF
jgi:ligand-binding sensor domain-containing protein